MHSQPQWKRHVGKVAVTLRLSCFGMTAEHITEALGIEPTRAQTAHEPAHFGPWGLNGALDCTLWSYDTSSRVASSDVNEHIKHLVEVFLPLKSRIEELRPIPHISVSIYWESILAGIAGPQLNAQCVSGLATLGGSVEIKVVKIEEAEGLNRFWKGH